MDPEWNSNSYASNRPYRRGGPRRPRYRPRNISGRGQQYQNDYAFVDNTFDDTSNQQPYYTQPQQQQYTQPQPAQKHYVRVEHPPSKPSQEQPTYSQKTSYASQSSQQVPSIQQQVPSIQQQIPSIQQQKTEEVTKHEAKSDLSTHDPSLNVDYEKRMISDIQEILEDLGYNEEQIESIESGVRETSKLYMDIIASLIAEISAMEGQISPNINTDINNKPQFWNQVFQFIKNNGYPYRMPKGSIEFQNFKSRLELTLFLLSELQACKMIGPLEPQYIIKASEQIKLTDDEKKNLSCSRHFM